MKNPPTADRRWRWKPCTDCPSHGWMFGRRKLCDACRIAKSVTPESLQKSSAQKAALDAVRRGILVRQTCVVCAPINREQTGKSHGHHEDYSKPLDVVWLCSFHHMQVHQYGLRRVVPVSPAEKESAA